MSNSKTPFETGFNETGPNVKENVFRVGTRLPRPYAPRHEAFRMAAATTWESQLVGYSVIVAWLEEGAPDANATLCSPATRNPPIPGHGTKDPNRMANELIEAGVFVDHRLNAPMVQDRQIDVLAFDVGEDIVGVLDLNTDKYTPYRGDRMSEGARRIVDCGGCDSQLQRGPLRSA